MSATSTTVLTVSQLTAAIKRQLEGGFPSFIVQGEISNFKPHSSGHLYFDLKDAEAKIPCVLFRAQTGGMSRMPKDGDQVRLKGSLTVYAPHGRYQMLVKEMEFAGVGELLLKLEELKRKLAERGWFDPIHKKPLPKFPRTIGVITSPTGAVIRDIIHVLSRRSSGFHLLLNPVRVQGSEAAQEIAQAIQFFNQHPVDVLIVGRGGGSLEDLWAFNELVVVEAIFNSKIPIISAVGHETDFTLSDFVASVRAPTPSAAAELAISETTAHLQNLKKFKQSFTHSLTHLIKRNKERLENFKRHPLFASPYALLAPPLQKLDELREKIDAAMQLQLIKKRLHIQGKQKELDALKPTVLLSAFRGQLTLFEKRLNLSIHSRLSVLKERLAQRVQNLLALDPKNVLRRGYSILFDPKTGSVIMSKNEMEPGKKIRALLSDGETVLTADEQSYD